MSCAQPLPCFCLALLPATAGAGGVPVLPAGAVMEVERAAHTATRLADGRVLVTGGIRRGEAALASAEIYDPRTSDFSATGEMTSVRVGHTATLLRDGLVLIAGGLDDDAQCGPSSSTTRRPAASRRPAR